ncbi:MAG TPA: SDR family NAD(P)-dependent oxidoreductase [Chloroflexota bacterium]|nr:SDR family NAD(P)-dependent oxidoreductase [Chloroflexota bacterium]
MGFRDQVAVVTGAGTGVGRAIALELARQGAVVCLVGRRLEALDAVAGEARVVSSRIVRLQADLTQDAAIGALLAQLKEEVRQIDVLVHSAGVITIGSIDTASMSDLDLQYRTNMRAPYALTQALLPMLLRRQGQVAFINSSAGLSACRGVGLYAASKHGLRALADSLREEVNERGVRVLSVYLGRTATPMQARLHELENKPYRPEQLIQPEDVATAVLALLDLPRTVEVTDVTLRPMRKPS